jgi:hypothetical protein
MVDLTKIKRSLQSATLKHRRVSVVLCGAVGQCGTCQPGVRPNHSLCPCTQPLQEAVKQLELQLASPWFLRQLDVNTVKLWPQDKLQGEQLPSAAGTAPVSSWATQQGQPRHPSVASDPPKGARSASAPG